MLTTREILLLNLFSGLDKREYELMVYLLTHNNQYHGTYTRLSYKLQSDISNTRKLVLSMVKKQYIVMVKDDTTNKRTIAISPVIIQYMNEC